MTKEEFEAFAEDIIAVLRQDPYEDTKASILQSIVPAVEVGIISLDQGDSLLKRISAIQLNPIPNPVDMD